MRPVEVLKFNFLNAFCGKVGSIFESLFLVEFRLFSNEFALFYHERGFYII